MEEKLIIKFRESREGYVAELSQEIDGAREFRCKDYDGLLNYLIGKLERFPGKRISVSFELNFPEQKRKLTTKLFIFYSKAKDYDSRQQ